jgi:hypothetical protein
MAALFGTYDAEPDCSNFFSQYKNLADAYVHRSADRHARSFWAGFGGIRSDVFRSVGGFDEQFARPCIEDLDLGDRVSAVGHRVLIDRRLHGRHLRRWTFRSMIASDVWDKGIPWTQLVLKSGRVQGLNPGVGQGASGALCCLSLLSLAATYWQPRFLVVASTALVATLYLNRRLYAFFLERRGLWFTCRAAAMNMLYHVCNAFSFAVGSALFYMPRKATAAEKAVDSKATNQAATS